MKKNTIKEAAYYYESLGNALEAFQKEVGTQFSIFREGPVSATMKINGFDCSSTNFAIFLGLLLFCRPTCSVRWLFFSEIAKKDAILRLEHFLNRLGVFVNLPQQPESLYNWLNEKDATTEQKMEDSSQET